MRIHISLMVSDLEDSIAFYRRLLGTSPTKRHADYANFRLDEPPLHLALVAGQAASAEGHHFGVELRGPEELATWRQRSTRSGLDGQDEANAECCYARGEKLWLTDPDGHHWEIWHRTGDFGALAPVSACCA